MSFWSGKTVLIVSPQSWDHIRISKHNYAIALAQQGTKVVFMNPPTDEVDESSLMPTDVDGVRQLTIPRPSFYRLRFHMRWLFDFLFARLVKTTLRKHQIRPDVGWCFDFNLYSNLNIFGASKTIFHPVDPLSEPQHVRPAITSNLNLTVSQKIADQISPAGVPVSVINHGLASVFESAAKSRKIGNYVPGDPVKVGYAGNLCRQPVNRPVIQQIVAEYPNVEFHFWGPHESSVPEIASFVKFLSKAPNTTLHGPVSQVQLASEYSSIDVFLLTYLADLKESDRSNSHKIVEYFSTGKVVVSSSIQHYQKHASLLVMGKTDDDSDLAELFGQTIASLMDANAEELQAKRIEFAVANSYSSHTETIAQMLSLT